MQGKCGCADESTYTNADNSMIGTIPVRAQRARDTASA